MFTLGHEKWKKKKKKFCPLAQQRHHSPSTFLKIRVFPLNTPTPSRSTCWKINWNQRQNVTWEAVRPSAGQLQRGVQSMSGTMESLSEVLSVSQGHSSTWQHGKKRILCVSVCVCVHLQFLQGWKEASKSPEYISSPRRLYWPLPGPCTDDHRTCQNTGRKSVPAVEPVFSNSTHKLL